MALTWWPSPAKLNLFLHINEQREDGYHSLQTVFQMLDRGDEIAFEPSECLQMATPMPDVSDEDNLILKAARLLQAHTNTQLGCRIHINKNLPMGGGVGGGSSNAATTLLVLNKLWNLNIANKTLQQLGLRLGADVPVFVNGETTFAEGVGESFSSITIPESWYLIVHPNIHVSTHTIFTEPDLPRSTPTITPEQYNFESTQNDCQKIVCNRHPEVAYLLQWLIQFAPSRMTGTGACVFAQFNAKHKAEETLAKLPSKWSGFVAKGVQTSPLIHQLESLRSYTF